MIYSGIAEIIKNNKVKEEQAKHKGLKDIKESELAKSKPLDLLPSTGASTAAVLAKLDRVNMLPSL